MVRCSFLALPVMLFSLPLLVAADWPCWRGPSRDGCSSEKEWLDVWKAGATPKVAWRTSVGKGHSCVVVSQGRAFTLGWDGKQDTIFAFDAVSGKELWKQSYPCGDIAQWSGPRATPAVVDGVVYSLSQHGHCHAWSAKDGKKLWETKLAPSYNPDVDYGFSSSPLVLGDHLHFGAGSRGLVLQKSDGKVIRGDGLHGACASAVPFRSGKQHGIAFLSTDKGRDSLRIVGVDAASGDLLWQSGPWPEKWGAACVDVIVHGDRVFLTTAEQHQRCGQFQIKGKTLEPVWENNRLSCYTGACVLFEDHLYGITKSGVLKCLEWKTGEEKWARRGFGNHGSLCLAGGQLLLQTSDRGELIVAAAWPAGYSESRRVKVFSKDLATFTAPVLANGRIYCRSYAGEVVCLDLTKK